MWCVVCGVCGVRCACVSVDMRVRVCVRLYVFACTGVYVWLRAVVCECVCE